MNNSKIKITKEPDTLVRASNKYDVSNEKVSFSFEEFNPDSVIDERINYNSFYQNVESSRNAVNDFFKIVKELSRYTIGTLMGAKSIKEACHICLIDRPEHIERIEKILKDSYGYPQGKIEEFGKEYFEFQISDGKRVIWHKVDNVIYPLFIDCNHMVCIDSSRSVKAKMRYNIKSSFSNLDETELNPEEVEVKDYLRMIIEESSNDVYFEKEDLLELLKDIVK